MKSGGDVKHKDINKQNILYFAARHEKEEVIKYLLTFNFPLNDDDFFMQTPLFYAAKYNKAARVSELLLRAGCDVNHKDGNKKNNALLNLEYMTYSENEKHAHSIGLKTPEMYSKKLDRNKVEAIREEHTPWNRARSYIVLAEKYKVNKNQL